MNSHEVDGPVVVSFGDISFNLCVRERERQIDKEEAFSYSQPVQDFVFNKINVHDDI